MNNSHELRINDPEALVTTRGTHDYTKSDVIEMGVNTFVDVPDSQPLYEKKSDGRRAHVIKRGIATLTAALAFVPGGFSQERSTTVHTIDVPVSHHTTVNPYDWDVTNRGKATGNEADQVAADIQRTIQQAEDRARAQVPAGGTVTGAETHVDMNTTGHADDSHRVGPNSNDQNLGKEDQYNDGLSEKRAEQTSDSVEQKLQNRGVNPDRVTTDHDERVLTPAEIRVGDEMAKRYGYKDFDELIQAVEHGWMKLHKHDQGVYDHMITNARQSEVSVNGTTTVTYETTKDGVLVAVPNGFVGISTEEHPEKIIRYTQGPQAHVSKRAIRGGAAQRPSGGGSVRKFGGATFRGSRHQGAFLGNSR